MKHWNKIFVVALGLSTFVGFMASAEGLHTYKIDAMKLTEQGVEAPLKNKDLTLTVSYRGKHGTLERVISAQTDAQGNATITFDENAEDQDYMTFDGVTQFCGKFDGPHYCASLSTSLNAEINGETVELTADSQRQKKYDCQIEHNPGFLTDTSSIHVLCKTGQ